MILGKTYELIEALGSTKTSGAGTNDESLYLDGRHFLMFEGWGGGGVSMDGGG